MACTHARRFPPAAAPRLSVLNGQIPRTEVRGLSPVVALRLWPTQIDDLCQSKESGQRHSTKPSLGLQLAMTISNPHETPPVTSPQTVDSLTSVQGETPENAADHKQWRSSRNRFDAYRDKVRGDELPKGSVHSSAPQTSASARARPAKTLLKRFFQLLSRFDGRLSGFWRRSQYQHCWR